MASSTLRLNEVPVATLGAFTEACAAHQTSDLGELAAFAGFSLSTGRKAVSTLETLGVVRRNDTGSYLVAVEGVTRGMSRDAMEQVIRRALLGFRPFEMLIEGIVLGEARGDAIRKTLLLLGLPASETSKLLTLIRWGGDLGILEPENGEIKLVADFTTENVEQMGTLAATDVESEAKARLFNARRLGRDASNYLDEVDRGLLADAPLNYESDPRKSIDASGQVIEDFLRQLANERGLGVDATRASGAGQLANLLCSKSTIHNHQQKMVDAVATIRNATAHRKDKKTLTPWELTSFGAFSALAMTLTAIRSIHLYVQN